MWKLAPRSPAEASRALNRGYAPVLHGVVSFPLFERVSAGIEKDRGPGGPRPDDGVDAPYAPSEKVHVLLASLQELYLEVR